MDFRTFILAICCLPGAAMSVYWSFGVVRLVRSRRALRRLRLSDASAAGDGLSVAIVIPAHNESRVIESLVRSLRAQRHPRLSFVLALDRCTDDTEDLARRAARGDARFEFVVIERCPEGWAGKTHAAWSAVRPSKAAAEADVLLFTDADVEMHPDLVRCAAGRMAGQATGLLSLWGELTRTKWFEKVVQPAACTEMMYRYPPARAAEADAARRRPCANGQFLMFRREAYLELGGHEGVREAMLEDMAFARAARDRGMRADMLVAGELLRVNMHGSWSAFRAGWKRILLECASHRVRRVRRIAARTRLMHGAGPVLAAAAGAAAVFVPAEGLTAPCAAAVGLGVIGLGLWGVVIGALLREFGVPLRYLPAAPIGAWLLGGIAAEAAEDLEARRTLTWGGRSYALTPR